MSERSDTNEKQEAERSPEFGRSTRRTFLSRLGMASLLATTAPVVTSLGQRPEKMGQGLSAAAKDAIPVSLTVNGKKYDLRIDPRTTLLDCLREHLHLTGSKKGCDHGQCGACTVHINGRRVNSFSLSPRCTTARKSQPLRGSDSRKIYTLFKLRSSPLTLINAVTAHRDRSCPRWRF